MQLETIETPVEQSAGEFTLDWTKVKLKSKNEFMGKCPKKVIHVPIYDMENNWNEPVFYLTIINKHIDDVIDDRFFIPSLLKRKGINPNRYKFTRHHIIEK